MVEFDLADNDIYCDRWELKTREDNTVIIHKVENPRKYTFDDMYCAFMGGYNSKGGQLDEFDEWLKKYKL
jgi:hypothetical protein